MRTRNEQTKTNPAKRVLCLLSVCVMILSVFAGCKNTDLPSRSKNGIAGYEDVVLGGFRSFKDDGPLDETETLTFAVPDDVSEENYYELMGLYIGEDYVYYYPLDMEVLYNDKEASFDIAHHSIYALAHPDKSVLIDEWTKRAAVNIVTKDDADGKMNVGIRGLVNETLDELGLDSESFGGEVYRYIISHDSKGEMLTAAVDGDYDTLKTKFATMAADGLVNLCFGVEGADDVIDVVTAASDSEDIAQGAKKLCEEIEKKVFPVIDVTEKFAKFVDKSFDIWANSTMDETYRYVFKKYADENGNISDDDWATVYATIHGAWARYKTRGIGEEELKQQFAERAKNETKIAEKEKELKKLVKKWDEDGLLNPYLFNYSRQWSVADRLKSLYNTRETIKSMFTKDGELQMGAYKGKMTEEEFIEELVYKWTYYGTKERDKFYKWLEDEGIVKKPVPTSKAYAWVRVATEIEKKDNEENEVYRTTREASETSHTVTCEYIWKDGPYEKAVFTATCEAPPEIIYADKEFRLRETLKVTGQNTTHFFDASCWYKTESPDVHFGGTTGRPKFENAEGIGTLSVGSHEEDEKSGDITVTGKLGAGSEGQKEGIFFCGCDADTRWIYEWKKVG